MVMKMYSHGLHKDSLQALMFETPRLGTVSTSKCSWRLEINLSSIWEYVAFISTGEKIKESVIQIVSFEYVDESLYRLAMSLEILELSV